MDNGCNFAFALAGIADFEEAYFTENHCGVSFLSCNC